MALAVMCMASLCGPSVASSAGMLCARTAPGTPPSCQRVVAPCSGAALLRCGEFCREHLTNVAHCGGCNVSCAAGQRCVGGACVAPIK